MKIVFDDAEARITGYKSIEFDEIQTFNFTNQLVVDPQEPYMNGQISIVGRNGKIVTK